MVIAGRTIDHSNANVHVCVGAAVTQHGLAHLKSKTERFLSQMKQLKKLAQFGKKGLKWNEIRNG